MPSNYTGDDTATQAPAPTPAKNATPVLALPVDGDGLNVASIYQALKALGDIGDFTFDRAAILDSINTFAEHQNFWKYLNFQDQAGASRTLVLPMATTSGVASRIYITPSSVEITVNANWSEGSGLWTPDNAGSTATKISFASGQWNFYEHTAAANWNDAGWSTAKFALSGSGELTTLAAITATVLDITALAGNIVAAGDPASDQARLRGKQIISAAGAAPTFTATGKPGCDNSVGDGSGSISAGSTDVVGIVGVTPGAATTNGVMIRVAFDKAYPAAPIVVLTPNNDAAVDLGWVPQVGSTTTYFEIASGTGAKKLPGGGGLHRWNYHVIG